MHIIYANTACDSIHLMNLSKRRTKQKHAMRIAHNKDKFEHAKHLFKLNEIFNVYQLNLLNIAVFMHNISTKTTPLPFTLPNIISFLYH